VNEILARAKAGDAIAQFCVGLMHYHGHGLSPFGALPGSMPTNHFKAREWFQLAANQGLSAAQFNLAWMLKGGEGGRGNSREAIAMYRRAAAQGHTDAQVMLANYYCEGVFDHSRQEFILPKNYLEAYIWYSIAIRFGHPVVDSNVLGICEYRLSAQQIQLGERRAKGFSPQCEFTKH
jgi:TPR repeat protein